MSVDITHTTECPCGDPDSSLTLCHGGDLYGPCDYEDCSGDCEYVGDCQCPLHAGNPDHDSWAFT